MQPTTSMSKDEFYKKYWFTPYQMITLINPKSEDYNFMVEGRHFIIRSGTREKVPGTVANIYLSQMTRIMAQDDDKMSFLSDYALMKQYFDKLIVDVDNLVQDYDVTPAYLKQVPDHMKVQIEKETPPWEKPKANELSNEIETGSKSSDEPKSNVAKDETKEFELKGDKFRMVTTKTGGSMFYKNGKLTSEAEYAKSASML
jgi:hypothetical protein